MNGTLKFTLSAILVIAVIGFVIYLILPESGENATRATVTGFGAHLQDVSLLAPQNDLMQSMQKAYGPYVAPDVLSMWQADPRGAPGRLTSSPWPARIDIDSVTERSPNAYVVTGTVVEATSAGQGQSYPITATVEKNNGVWRIASFFGYPPPEVPAAGAITVEGETLCLPHRDMSGPQTLECALGIEDDTGRYFALSSTASATSALADAPTGSRLRISGTFSPRQNSNYRDVGVITVTSATKVATATP